MPTALAIVGLRTRPAAVDSIRMLCHPESPRIFFVVGIRHSRIAFQLISCVLRTVALAKEIVASGGRIFWSFVKNIASVMALKCLSRIWRAQIRRQSCFEQSWGVGHSLWFVTSRHLSDSIAPGIEWALPVIDADLVTFVFTSRRAFVSLWVELCGNEQIRTGK